MVGRGRTRAGCAQARFLRTGERARDDAHGERLQVSQMLFPRMATKEHGVELLGDRLELGARQRGTCFKDEFLDKRHRCRGLHDVHLGSAEHHCDAQRLVTGCGVP